MKSLVNYALFKEQLKRFWAIAALASIWYILFAVSPLWSSMASRGDMYAAESILRIITMRNAVIQVAAVVVPFAAAISIFSFLFQSKSVTAMYSYPLNKKQLYCTNVAVGIVLMAIPLLILCACLLNPVVWQLPEMRIEPVTGEAFFDRFVPSIPAQIFPNGIADGAVVNTLPVIAGFFGKALLTNIFYFAMFMLAVMVAGNAVVSFLICGILPFIPCALMLLGYMTGSFFFFGFEAFWFEETIMKVLTFTNPAAIGSMYSFYSVNGQPSAAASLFIYFAAYILIAAGLFAVSYWCSRVRRQERAGDSVVFVPLRNVLIFLLSTAGMIFLGAFFLGAFRSVALMYAGFVLGFIVAYFIAQMIAEKTFNVLFKLKDLVKYGGVMAALVIIIASTARLDLLGYQTYLPVLDEVYGVYLHQPYTMNDYTGEAQTEEHKRSFFVTDRRIIADTLAFHNSIIAERHSLRSTFLRSLEGNNAESGISEQYISYLLNNGKYVTRKYALPENFSQSAELTGLLSEEAIILSPYSTYRTPEKLNRIMLQYTEYSGGGSDFVKNEPRANSAMPVYIEEQAEIKSVIKEIEKDIVATERKRIRDRGQADISWESGMSGYAEIYVENGSRSSGHFNLDSYENVDKWLEERGLKPEIGQ